ncbi:MULTISPECIES: methyltransferase domain-containing protein [Rhodomicrobium]|uniref:class I SAM-dependent methyltransferase n=2 Tax=Rhodomicrobium TaxID=1068 RepID=UPI000B4C028B|nr:MULTISPECIES: methyltransferase domain-containing protein [Rhodomicrobium]
MWRGASWAMLAIALYLASVSQTGAADHRFLGPAGAPATQFPKPDRPVADIVAPLWHSEEERDGFDEPGQLARLLGMRPGMTVADIGAGSGYLTVRLSPVVGPRGRIFAQDVEASYLKDLGERVKALDLKNVTVSLGEAHDPRLPPASVDVAILVHMYHEISDPYALLYNLAPALKRGGQVGIVDTRAATSRHGTPPELLACELAAVGYRQVAVHSLAGSDTYLAIFTPPAAEARKRPAEIAACKAG